MSIERDRALVRAGYSWGIDAANGNGPTPLTDEIVLHVNRTHPPTDEALLLAVAEAVRDACVTGSGPTRSLAHLDLPDIIARVADERRLRAEVEILRGPFVAATVQLGTVTMAGEVWATCPGVPGNDGRCPVCGIAPTITGVQHSRRIA